jgi:integrase
MARVERLTALRVQRERRPGMHPDGRGLYLRISKSGARSWLLRYMLHGRRHDLGLGSAYDISLAQARERATEARRLKADGVDPLARKRASRAATRVADAKLVTFKDAATAYIAANRSAWRSPKHAADWQQSLSDHAFPIIGELPVSEIDTALIVRVLEPMWNAKPITAARVRSRIELILDWARVRGYREGENPARWRGHIAAILPKPLKVNREEHHAALPYRDIPQFMADLRQRHDAGARALEFLILTAARSGEVRLSTAAEFDIPAAVWTIPADHMKGGATHRVPLAAPALVLVDDACSYTAKSTMRKMLAKLRADATVHGFRSSFRDWAAERTDFANHVVEQALAHTVGSEVERAYRRTDLFDRRRELMDAWAAYCGGEE